MVRLKVMVGPHRGFVVELGGTTTAPQTLTLFTAEGVPIAYLCGEREARFDGKSEARHVARYHARPVVVFGKESTWGTRPEFSLRSDPPAAPETTRAIEFLIESTKRRPE